MHLTYTTRSTGFEPGKAYRNPEYFHRADMRADSVTIEGEYPQIAEAYRNAGIEVIDQDESQEEGAADEAREALAAEYEQRTGKKAGRMKAETLQEKLDELEEQEGE